jgi:hypothetical protein
MKDKELEDERMVKDAMKPLHTPYERPAGPRPFDD